MSSYRADLGAGCRGSEGPRSKWSCRTAWASRVCGGGVPTDEKQVPGLEKEVMITACRGLHPYNMLAPKAASDTKEDANLVPSITNKHVVGCTCEEGNSAVILFWLHKGKTQRCPSCGTHYKLVPQQLNSCTSSLKMCYKVSYFQ
uniref:Cytochrome c oxidase subunit 5B, mitochondrial n=1 Tax=Sus scrofa TaxID=9823 RepID=A0A8D1Z244_PIG